jgi:hypothetical protein
MNPTQPPLNFGVGQPQLLFNQWRIGISSCRFTSHRTICSTWSKAASWPPTSSSDVSTSRQGTLCEADIRSGSSKSSIARAVASIHGFRLGHDGPRCSRRLQPRLSTKHGATVVWLPTRKVERAGNCFLPKSSPIRRTPIRMCRPPSAQLAHSRHFDRRQALHNRVEFTRFGSRRCQIVGSRSCAARAAVSEGRLPRLRT